MGGCLGNQLNFNIVVLVVLKLLISFKMFLIHLLDSLSFSLSPPILPFPFIYMGHISFSLRALTDVLHRLVQLIQEEECVSTSFVISETLHTYIDTFHYTVRIQPQSYLQSASPKWYEYYCKIGSRPPSTMNTFTRTSTYGLQLSHNIESRKNCSLYLS